MSNKDAGSLLDAYTCGKTFSYGYRILLKKHMDARKTLELQDFSLIIPILVNGAFSAELFLKYLIGVESKGHNLYSLMNRLNRINREKYENIIEVTIYAMNNRNNRYNRRNFNDDLKACSNMFEKIRYIYEPCQSEVVYNLGFLECFIAALESLCNEYKKLEINKRDVFRFSPAKGYDSPQYFAPPTPFVSITNFVDN